MQREDLLKMIGESWTYARLTSYEKALWQIATERIQESGTHKQRFAHLLDAYYAFLLGCGYPASQEGHEAFHFMHQPAEVEWREDQISKKS